MEENKLIIHGKGFFNGIMVFWNRIDDAIYYQVELSIEDTFLTSLVVEKNKCYFSFTDLAFYEYTVKVKAYTKDDITYEGSISLFPKDEFDVTE